MLSGAGLLAVGLVVAGIGTALPAVGLVAGGLFLVGLGTGTWDVAMNLQGAEVERALGRNVMPHYHAWFSLGTVGAAGIGALAAWARRAGAWCTWCSPRLVALIAAAVGRAPVPARPQRPAPPEPRPAPRRAARHPLAAWLEPRTLLIGVLVLAAAVHRGRRPTTGSSVGDHRRLRHAAPGSARSGFAAFVSAMTVGRVLGTVAGWTATGGCRCCWASFALAAVGALLVDLRPGARAGRGVRRRAALGRWAPRSASRWA